MIIRMFRVRMMGPRQELGDVMSTLRDVGVVHVADVVEEPLGLQQFEQASVAEHMPALEEAARQIESALTTLRVPIKAVESATEETDTARLVHLAHRVFRQTQRLQRRHAELQEERAALERYARFFQAFGSVLQDTGDLRHAHTSHLILRSGADAAIEKLREILEAEAPGRYEIHDREIAGGERAVLLVLPAAVGTRMEELLAGVGVQELEVPEWYGSSTLAGAMPAMLRRLEEIPGELDQVEEEGRALAESRGQELLAALSSLHNLIDELQVQRLVAQTEHAFVLEGWVPRSEFNRLSERLQAEYSGRVVIEKLTEEEWMGQQAPVVLSNPRLFRPFEAITRMLPLPRYGTLDPTPFVGVFFPMFFGIMLGDVVYGLVLAVIALLLRARSEEGSTLRSVSEIAGACAAFTVILGLLYGEFLGDLGHRWFGLEPLAFDRQEALMPFLALAVGLGAVHVVLGLVLGLVTSIGHGGRHTAGKAVSTAATVLVVVAILAAVRILPGGLLLPAVIAIGVAFPLLLILEGIVAPIEFLSTLGNILSYARVMALGTASVMLAVVANEMVGAFGAPLIGALFALVFHLVNLAIGIFSPTIHALRLHYVEFFGKFYSPGGTPYRPLQHWRPGNNHGSAGTR